MVIYTMMPKLNNPLEIQKYKYIMDISWPNKMKKKSLHINTVGFWSVTLFFI